MYIMTKKMTVERLAYLIHNITSWLYYDTLEIKAYINTWLGRKQLQ